MKNEMSFFVKLRVGPRTKTEVFVEYSGDGGKDMNVGGMPVSKAHIAMIMRNVLRKWLEGQAEKFSRAREPRQ